MESWGWAMTALVPLMSWCTYQIGYRRGLRRSRTLYEPVIDELYRRIEDLEPTPNWDERRRRALTRAR